MFESFVDVLTLFKKGKVNFEGVVGKINDVFGLAHLHDEIMNSLNSSSL